MHRRTTTIAALVPLATLALLTGCSSSEPGSSDPETTGAAGDCTPAHTFETVTEGVLTVAAPELAPFSTVESADSASGIDVDIVEHIAAAECLDVIYQAVSYAQAIPEVQSGRADLAVGDYYRTAIRAEIVALSDPLYLDGMGLISVDGVSTITELESVQVGTVDGYLWVTDLQAVLGDGLSVYPSNVEMLQDLETGRIEVAIDGFGAAVAATEGTEYQVVTAEPDDRVASSVEAAQATLPHNPDNPDLTTALNANIAEMHEDGTIVSILESYGLDASLAEVGEPRLIE